MVKTRKSGENDDSFIGEYLALDTRRSRKRRDVYQNVNGYGHDSGDDSDYTSARQSRSSAVHHGSPDQDPSPRMATRRQSHKDDPSPDIPMDDTPMNGYMVRRSSPRARRLCELDLEAETYNGIRRSTRQRKLLYGTFNQNLIDKHMLAVITANENDENDPQPKRRREVHVESTKTEEGEQQNTVQDELDKDVDMYSRVKRPRRQTSRFMYDVSDKEKPETNDSGEDVTESCSSESSSEEEQGRSYDLREHKPRVSLYEAPPIEPQRRPRNLFRSETPPPSIPRGTTHRSPARKKDFFKKRRRPTFHGNSSTSSSGESSDDERRFERRKVKSMAKSRQRCLPMNLATEDVATGVLRERAKVGASLADIDPMNIDKSVNFDSVGGLKKHIRALKEMIVFPLMYPEVFDRFKIQPPRGVLFHGPPGTGKTLVARALANECSHGEKKVSFFMRKGADCLSKWVGESERQLRLLFDQAYQMRPSIIFFDEIDGLAPVRSSRQDQIHSSIVSTLLALMDGLDSRGEIVVIGATNRIDSIDPALRRPGRFDREFLFPLPPVEARKQILQIHTKQWNPKLLDSFLHEVAEKCVGYCGADLRALCTETALHALRRRYPQIYNSQEKLQLDVTSIEIGAKDFQCGMQSIVPTSQRSLTSPSRPLSHALQPLLKGMIDKLMESVQKVFPISFPELKAGASNQETSVNTDDELFSDEEEDAPCIFESKTRKRKTSDNNLPTRPYLDFASTSYHRVVTYRPRLLLAGYAGQGQSIHLAPALLHQMEKLPVHVLDLPALFGVSAKTPEESCAQIFREARRSCPSVVYIPHLCQWWDVLSDTMHATFCTLLQDLDSSAPLMLLATVDQPYNQLPEMLQNLFNVDGGEVVTTLDPMEGERHGYFADLLLHQATKAPSCKKKAAERLLEVLPAAAPEPPRELTESELKRLRSEEEKTLRELRLFLRDVIGKLARDRKFTLFTKPVDVEDVPDYYEIIAKPMDLSTMMSKIDLHKYLTVAEFMEDIEQICSNALEYNPDRCPGDRAIRHRACALRDTANAIIVSELDNEFEKQCEEIKEARERRNESPEKTTPKYYYTKPLYERMKLGEVLREDLPDGYPSRFSRRARGMEASEEDMHSHNAIGGEAADSTSKYRIVTRKVSRPRAKKVVKSPWLKATKRLYQYVNYYVDSEGNQFSEKQFEIDVDGNLKPKANLEEKTAAVEDEQEADDSCSVEKSGEAQAVIPKYDIIQKKVIVKRKKERLGSHRSPWCRPSKRVHRTVTMYVDAQGNEFSAEDYLLDNNGDLIQKQEANGENQSEISNKDGEKTVDEVTEKAEAEKDSCEEDKCVATQDVDLKASPSSVKCSPRTGASPHIAVPTTRSPARSVVKTSPTALTECITPAHSTSPRLHFTRKRSHSGGFDVIDEEEEEQTKEVDISQDIPAVVHDGETTGASRHNSESTEDSTHNITSAVMDVDKKTPGSRNDEQNQEGSDKATPVSRRSARFRCTQMLRAAEVLQQPKRHVVVDMSRLEHLLLRVVAQTGFCGVERLERLYSQFSHCIYRHRNDYDKTLLAQDLENTFEQFVRK